MIQILRLNHRIHRDERLTTHVALTSRAFLASKLYYSGQKDSSFEDSIKKINQKFGSSFEVEYANNPLNLIKQKQQQNYKTIHLTIYGLQFSKQLKNIKKHKNLLIIVGGAKVEPEYYKVSDYNISITSQPISEVSALAIFLHEYLQGKELTSEFKNAKTKIIPSKDKKLIKN